MRVRQTLSVTQGTELGKQMLFGIVKFMHQATFCLHYLLLPLSRHECPIVEIENHGRIVLVAAHAREICARTVFGGDGAQAQRSNIAAPRHLGSRQYFSPSKYRAACKKWRNVSAAIDFSDMKCVGKPVE